MPRGGRGLRLAAGAKGGGHGPEGRAALPVPAGGLQDTEQDGRIAPELGRPDGVGRPSAAACRPPHAGCPAVAPSKIQLEWRVRINLSTWQALRKQVKDRWQYKRQHAGSCLNPEPQRVRCIPPRGSRRRLRRSISTPCASLPAPPQLPAARSSAHRPGWRWCGGRRTRKGRCPGGPGGTGQWVAPAQTKAGAGAQGTV